jgi:type II secretion system protein G
MSGMRAAEPDPARPSAGFTLVELLVVIVILGVLAGVVIFAVSGVTSKASSNACQTDVKTVENALEVWKAQSGTYPSVGTPGQTQLTTGPNATLRSWPSSSQYTITLDPATAGQVDVTLPGGTPVAVGSGGQPCDASATSSSIPATSTTSSSTTTTTTAPVSNGVTVTPSVSPGTSAWWGENQLTITNPAPMTALSVTVNVARTTGVNGAGQYTTFWGGTIDSGQSVTASTVSYTFVANTSIVAGSWFLGSQYSGTGTPRVTSGDTWSVTSTSGGVTSTLSGTF